MSRSISQHAAFSEAYQTEPMPNVNLNAIAFDTSEGFVEADIGCGLNKSTAS
jgi:hypothetical protein